MGGKIRHFWELEVYRLAFRAAMDIFEITKQFPKEELFSVTDQARRASRSVTANIAEAWHKRRYPAAFASKLNDAEAEAAETQNWLFYAHACGYLSTTQKDVLKQSYDKIIGKLVTMIKNPQHWTLKK